MPVTMPGRVSRPFFAEEVLQTSGMDCGPAALKSILGGLGVACSYDRIRDACHTGADGTSIDALEDLCVALGLEAYQELAPMADAATILEAQAPCVVVVRGPGDAPHFVVVWRAFAGWFQLMDPGRGRRWVSRQELLQELHSHRQRFDDAETFRDWFVTTTWYQCARGRTRDLGAPGALDPLPDDVRTIAAVEGAACLVERLAKHKALGRAQRRPFFESVVRADLGAKDEDCVVPEALRGCGWDAERGTPVARGCVFLVVRKTGGAATSEAADPALMRQVLLQPGQQGPSAGGVLWSLLSAHARQLLTLLVFFAAVSTVLSLSEMFVLRAAFNAQSLLSLPQQRFAGTATYALLVAMLLGVDVALDAGALRLGRDLELTLRLRLLRKLPRLPDRYFRTRPLSDTTHRSQGLFVFRGLPNVVVSLAKVTLNTLITLVALVLLYPRGAPWLAVPLFFGVVLPHVSLRWRRQIEARVQNHASGLSQLYLDILLGLAPIRSHGGELALRARQDELLVDWQKESARGLRGVSVVEAVQSVGTLVGVALLLLDFITHATHPGDLLLVAFWALRLPIYARSFASGLQQLPGLLASLSRLVEPLTAEESAPSRAAPEGTQIIATRGGVGIEVKGATVVLGTQRVLDDVSLSIAPGEHVAIVGSSGAGKSSFLGMLLGLLERTQGEVRVDGMELEAYDIGRLRRECVWVDPQLQLWNQSLLENLHFGNPTVARDPLRTAVDNLGLKELLQRMPEGMATPLGESGARVSGGEGQRVRLGRALLRRGARLVLLDEAFRGLDRQARRAYSRAMRSRVGQATVLEITHDVADTQAFHRILVIENGKLVEQGRPADLLAQPSRYRALVEADLAVQRDVWGAADWRRVVVDHGKVRTDESRPGAATHA